MTSPGPVARSALRQTFALVTVLLVTFAAAGVGSIASSRGEAFYAGLQRPDWAPPGWVFAPVWSALYLMMGVAAWLVWRHAREWRAVAPALAIYLLQLIANALWTWLFFAWRSGGWAFAEVLVLALLVGATMGAFRRHSATAALLLVPYLAWVLFAAALTFATWRLNPSVLG